MRPVNATLLAPVCPVRVSVAVVMVRAQRGLWRSLRLSARQRRPTRRPRALRLIAILIVAGWSSWKKKVVPRLWRFAAVWPVSGVDERSAVKIELVSPNAEIVALVGGPGGGGGDA